MWSRAYLVRTDVLEEHIASICRVEKSESEEPAWASGCRLNHHFEDGGDTFLRNVDFHKIYTAPYPRRRHSS
jgi:hypothetical protein